MHDKIMEQMKPMFELAAIGFDAFYKSAEHSSSGGYSTAASSGDYSTAASSGDYSKAASSGDYSKAASSGGSSTAASSGDSSTAASSGGYSTAASSGDYSTAASSGGSSKAASSGDSSTAASSGYYSKAASSGDSSTAASSGGYSTAASSGGSSTAASSGYYSKAASSGNFAACSALGYRSAVKGDIGNLLMASEFQLRNGAYVPIGGLAALVDGKILKPKCWYIVECGEWVEVDHTDGVFSRVLSSKKGVRKVKTDDGKTLYVVFDDKGNAAHGATVKEARADLIYKIVAKFDGALPQSATGKEWIGIYRAVTGACAAGVRGFVEQRNIDLEATYSAADVATMVSGSFGADSFRAKMEGK